MNLKRSLKDRSQKKNGNSLCWKARMTQEVGRADSAGHTALKQGHGIVCLPASRGGGGGGSDWAAGPKRGGKVKSNSSSKCWQPVWRYYQAFTRREDAWDDTEQWAQKKANQLKRGTAGRQQVQTAPNQTSVHPPPGTALLQPGWQSESKSHRIKENMESFR